MSISLPQFNLNVEITTTYGAPNGALTWTGPYACQKYIYSRRDPDPGSLASYWGQSICQFRMEPTAFYAAFALVNMPTWGIVLLRFNSSPIRYYRVFNWEVVHEGLPNEYPAIWAQMCRASDGMFITPGGGNTNGVPVGFPYLMGPMP